MDQAKPKRPRGRPIGAVQYDEPKVNKTHRLTPKGHQWVKENKAKIEEEARK